MLLILAVCLLLFFRLTNSDAVIHGNDMSEQRLLNKNVYIEVGFIQRSMTLTSSNFAMTKSCVEHKNAESWELFIVYVSRTAETYLSVP